MEYITTEYSYEMMVLNKTDRINYADRMSIGEKYIREDSFALALTIISRKLQKKNVKTRTHKFLLALLFSFSLLLNPNGCCCFICLYRTYKSIHK